MELANGRSPGLVVFALFTEAAQRMVRYHLLSSLLLDHYEGPAKELVLVAQQQDGRMITSMDRGNRRQASSPWTFSFCINTQTTPSPV